VSASGDHVINAIANGAREIDAFDYNPHALMWTELKLRALTAIDDYKQYISFFTKRGKFLDKDIFNDLKYELRLNYATRLFFNNVIDNKSVKLSIPLVRQWGMTYDDMYVNNPYLKDQKAFDHARQAVDESDITLWHTGVDKLPEIMGDKHYDFAVLSNICGHVGKPFPDFLDEFVMPILKNTDKVQADYQWQGSKGYIDNEMVFIKNTIDRRKDFFTHDIKGVKLATRAFAQSPYEEAKHDNFGWNFDWITEVTK